MRRDLFRSASFLILFATAPFVATAEVRLFKDIDGGVDKSEILSRPGYYDCSVSGLVSACLDNQSFLSASGTISVIFTGGITSRVIFSSNELSLYQNAMTTFTGNDYALVGIETPAGMFDFVYSLNADGREAAVAKITEVEQAGLTNGFVKYFFFESPQEESIRYKNITDFGMNLPSGSRVITLAVAEDEYGNVETLVIFEPNLTDSEKLTSGVRDSLKEDF